MILRPPIYVEALNSTNKQFRDNRLYAEHIESVSKRNTNDDARLKMRAQPLQYCGFRFRMRWCAVLVLQVAVRWQQQSLKFLSFNVTFYWSRHLSCTVLNIFMKSSCYIFRGSKKIFCSRRSLKVFPAHKLFKFPLTFVFCYIAPNLVSFILMLKRVSF